jgi:hypothetical protein
LQKITVTARKNSMTCSSVFTDETRRQTNHSESGVIIRREKLLAAFCSEMERPSANRSD